MGCLACKNLFTQQTSRYRGNPMTGRASDVESNSVAPPLLLGTCPSGTFMVALIPNGPTCKAPPFYETTCKKGQYLSGFDFKGDQRGGLDEKRADSRRFKVLSGLL